MAIFTLCDKDCLPPVYDSIKEMSDGFYAEHPSMQGYVMVETYRGRVVNLREMNAYDDSDFYATVQGNDGKFFEVMYATTRGWTYANDAVIDASESVKNDYRQWLRRNHIMERLAIRCNRRELAGSMQLNRFQLRKLEKGCGVYFDCVKVLLTTKKFRSEFRASLAKQVRDWINNPNPQYDTPLSAKQLWYLVG